MRLSFEPSVQLTPGPVPGLPFCELGRWCGCNCGASCVVQIRGKHKLSANRRFFCTSASAIWLQAPTTVNLSKPPADARCLQHGRSRIPAFAGMTAVGVVGRGCGCRKQRWRSYPHPGPLPGGEGEEQDGLWPQPRRIHHTSRASRTPRASATFMTAPKRVFWPGRASRSWSP